MLTLKKVKDSIPIAKIDGGVNNGKYIRLVNDTYDIEDDDPEFSDIIDYDFLSSLYKKQLKPEDIEDLESFFKKRKKIPDHLKNIALKVIEHYEDRKNKEICIHDGVVIPLPNTKLDREVCYIAGPSGSGKSTYVANFAKQCKKINPDDELIIFSRLTKDKVLDKLNPSRIKIDDNLIEDPIDIQEELANSVTIFDDIDTIRDKQLRESVQDIRDDILETGRHAKITCLCTSHQLMNYSKTRVLLNEATSCTFFPGSGSSYHIKRFLKEYAGLDKKQIQRILNLPSRWVTLHKSYPQYIIYQQGVYLLK